MEVKSVLLIILAALSAYLIGSLNFAIIVSRLFAKKDIRDYGSGNAGMTNVLRTFGKWPAVITTIGDFLKGVGAVLLGKYILSFVVMEMLDYVGYFVAIPALLGHCFPIFYHFKGGKGILVSAGVICMINPLVLLIILSVFIIVVAIWKMVSLASISAALAFPISVLAFSLSAHSQTVFTDIMWAVIMGALVIFMHRSNIQRIKNGTESKLFQKK